MWGDPDTDALVGRTIKTIHWSETRVVFDTDAGLIGYRVVGDCCSWSYFHDFFGVKHLLDNGPVTEVTAVDLEKSDPRFKVPVPEEEVGYNFTEVYGFRLTTVHPQFGEVSSVLSFRNDSNGYYGGWMERDDSPVSPSAIILTDDYLGD